MTDTPGSGYGHDHRAYENADQSDWPERPEFLRRTADQSSTPPDDLTDEELRTELSEESRRFGPVTAALFAQPSHPEIHRSEWDSTYKTPDNDEPDNADPTNPPDEPDSADPTNPLRQSSSGELDVARLDLEDRLDDDPTSPTVRQILERYAGPDGLTDQQEDTDRAYVRAHLNERPWLQSAVDANPLVRHVIVDRDRSGGHDLQRHDSWRDDQAQADRVQHWKDPAHPTDSPGYHASTDAIRGGDSVPIDRRQREEQQHNTGDCATRVPDPVSYATTVALISQHPKVRGALETPPSEQAPGAIRALSIKEILGPDGHRHCTGYRLSFEGFETPKQAIKNSRNWTREIRAEFSQGADDRNEATDAVRQRTENGELNLREPDSERISSFEGGHFVVAFRRKSDQSGFEIATIYPRPSIME